MTKYWDLNSVGIKYPAPKKKLDATDVKKRKLLTMYGRSGRRLDQGLKTVKATADKQLTVKGGAKKIQ